MSKPASSTTFFTSRPGPECVCVAANNSPCDRSGPPAAVIRKRIASRISMLTPTVSQPRNTTVWCGPSTATACSVGWV